MFQEQSEDRSESKASCSERSRDKHTVINALLPDGPCCCKAVRETKETPPPTTGKTNTQKRRQLLQSFQGWSLRSAQAGCAWPEVQGGAAAARLCRSLGWARHKASILPPVGYLKQSLVHVIADSTARQHRLPSPSLGTWIPSAPQERQPALPRDSQAIDNSSTYSRGGADSFSLPRMKRRLKMSGGEDRIPLCFDTFCSWSSHLTESAKRHPLGSSSTKLGPGSSI